MAQVDLLDGHNIFDEEYIPIKVIVAEHNSGHKYHSHSFYEFVYIDRGFSNHYYNQTTTLLTPGDVFGMRPGDVHGYIYPEHTILYNCVFKPEALADELKSVKALAGVGQILDVHQPAVWQRIHLDPIARKEAVFILDTMRLESRTRAPGWELKLKSLLISFLVLFSRAFGTCYVGDETTSYKYAGI